MKMIFEQTQIGTLTVKNRLVRSAMWENMADSKGQLTQELFDLYQGLAKGGAGLLITGYAFVTAEEQPNPGMMGIYDDSFINHYKHLTDMVHEHDSKIIMQIAYGGSQTGYRPEGRTIWGPSAVADLAFGVTPTPMSKDDISTLVQAFADAAARVKTAGFDGVQIHGAHGYLLSQFLSPHYNRRTDEYGGPIANRVRIIEEIYHAMRQQIGDDFPVLLKINASDFIENGLSFDESLFVAKRMAELGIDAIEISGGTFASGDNNPCRTKIQSADQEAYQAKHAISVAEDINVPVILVGGLRSPEVIESLIKNSKIALCSLARPLLAEPDLPARWEKGDDSRARCVSCNSCLLKSENRVTCVLN